MSKQKYFIWSIHSNLTAKREDELSFFSTDEKKTVSGLLGPLVPITFEDQTTPKPRITGTSRFRVKNYSVVAVSFFFFSIPSQSGDDGSYYNLKHVESR